MRLRPILRPDLEQKFRARALAFEHELGREFAIPVVAFHGTKKEAVASISKSGLVLPGAGNNVRVQHGSRFGQGIYSSPDPNFAALYCAFFFCPPSVFLSSHFLCAARDGKLIVCAVLLGKAKV